MHVCNRTPFLTSLSAVYCQTTFDVTRASAGVAFDHGNKVVTQNISSSTHKMVVATEGFESPSKVFSAFRVLDGGTNMIGASDACAPALFTSSYYPGYSADKGVALYGSNGHRYFQNTYAAMPGKNVSGQSIIF
jgi:hypothetical protein